MTFFLVLQNNERVSNTFIISSLTTGSPLSNLIISPQISQKKHKPPERNVIIQIEQPSFINTHIPIFHLVSTKDMLFIFLYLYKNKGHSTHPQGSNYCT